VVATLNEALCERALAACGPAGALAAECAKARAAAARPAPCPDP